LVQFLAITHAFLTHSFRSLRREDEEKAPIESEHRVNCVSILLFTMDLFAIRRFGEEDQTEAKDDTDVIKALKDKLKKAKREKKKDDEGEQGEDDVHQDEGDEGEEEKPGKKRRKKRSKKRKALAEDSEFTVLGGDLDQQGRAKVRRVLPEWLANPEAAVSADLGQCKQMPVDEMDQLDKDLKEKLKEQKISSFFPVQQIVIPLLLRATLTPYGSRFPPGDVCVSAPTGSGKTLAFVLPIVQALRKRTAPQVRALAVLPTQDLAAQVAKVFQTYACGLKVKLLSPAKPFEQERVELAKRGAAKWHSMADVLVSTPGRLVDHLKKTEGLEWHGLRFLIVDEADRVMESMQNNWLETLEEKVYTGGRVRMRSLTVAALSRKDLPLQKLLFSATLSQNPEQLEQLHLFEPKLITSAVKPKDISTVQDSANSLADAYMTPKELKESYVLVEDSLKKPQVMHYLLTDVKKALIFTKSLEHAQMLAAMLVAYGHRADELSSRLDRKTRMKALKRLKDGSTRALVCTDALARGVDVEEVDTVFSYDCPSLVRTYVHRAGRTARAGRGGHCVTLCEPGEDKKLLAMLREAGKDASAVAKLDVEADQLDNDAYQEAKAKTAEILQKKKK